MNYGVVNECYNCKERRVGCHAECESYKAYRAELDDINARTRKQSGTAIMLRECAERRLRKSVKIRSQK